MIKKLHNVYIVCTCLLLLGCWPGLKAQTILTPGDIVVLGWNSDESYPNQKWAFLAMTDILAGTSIIFTDNGYDASTGNFRAPSSSDGFLTYIVQSLISRGTVVYGTNTTINGSTAGVSGQLGNPSTPFGFSNFGDQLIVYQGTSGTATGATFIYALNTGQNTAYGANGAWYTGGAAISVDVLSYLPPGLTNGVTAVALTANTLNLSVGTGLLGSANYGFDNMAYGGTTTGTKSTLLTAIANPANWLGSDATAFNLAAGSGVFPGNVFSVLPVTLLQFKAEEATAGIVKLSWSTAMEVNNDHFTLERSSDGLHYTVIGTVAGRGDNNQPVDYSFTDKAAEQGSNYYRLTQFDRDGQSKILGTRKVEVREIALRVGPNPAVHFVDVAFASGAWREVKLYNSADQLLQTISPAPNTSRVRISLQNYRAGTYYLAFVANIGQGNTVRRFVKRE
ncbi:hypothetical protein [Niastella populi]|uniref:Secretion system C-terminal sorting domain-containing protein n=1 Tax=Niastella populi TaxID=550983 RepID=A0A1V9FI99_9BACT|nr:hypothetical protein [Niastella populi]OQP58007.1 hypothetical protein A4R26_23180 [Niastella populi]